MMTNRFSRMVLIDHRGPAPTKGVVFQAHNSRVEVSIQDDGHTLKVFLYDGDDAR